MGIPHPKKLDAGAARLLAEGARASCAVEGTFVPSYADHATLDVVHGSRAKDKPLEAMAGRFEQSSACCALVD